jgi:hypothetical protein
MPEFSIQHSGGEPQGTAGAKATQSHTGAKVEGRRMNAETQPMRPQSHINATSKPTQSLLIAN